MLNEYLLVWLLCVHILLSIYCLFTSICCHTDQLVSQYLSALESPEVLTRCGCALALGSLPPFMIHGKLQQVTPHNASCFQLKCESEPLG